jgi:hypothetical protein
MMSPEDNIPLPTGVVVITASPEDNIPLPTGVVVITASPAQEDSNIVNAYEDDLPKTETPLSTGVVVITASPAQEDSNIVNAYEQVPCCGNCKYIIALTIMISLIATVGFLCMIIYTIKFVYYKNHPYTAYYYYGE